MNAEVKNAFTLTSILIVLSLVALGNAMAARNQEAGRHYEDALSRFEKGDFAGANVQLMNALHRDPEMLAAHILLGKTQLQTGQVLAATETFEKALRLGADRVEIAIPFAEALLNVGKPGRLLELFPIETFALNLRPELLLLRGNAYIQQGKFDAAVQSFQQSRALSPQYSPAIIAHAEIALRRGERVEAMALAEEAIRVAPNGANAWVTKGTIAHTNLDLQTALKCYEKALYFDEQNIEARVGRASLLIDLGRFDESAADAALLAKNSPLEPRGSYIRAILAQKRGDMKAWRDALLETARLVELMAPELLKVRAPKLLLLAAMANNGLGQNEKARAYLETFLQVDSNHLGARKILAAIYLSQGNAKEAAQLLDGELKYAGNDPQVFALLAAANMALSRPQAASRYLEQALQLSGSSADLHAALGLSLLEYGQTKPALEHLEKAFLKNSGLARVGVALATMLLQHGEVKRALEVSEAAAKHSPGDLIALNLVGVARGIAGDKKGARAAYEQILKINPNYLAAALNLARLDRIEGKMQAARGRLTRLLEARPKDSGVMFEFGILEDETGNIAEAIRWYEKVRDTDRRHIPGMVSLIDAQIRSGNVVRALEVAKEAESVHPRDYDVLAVIGRAYLSVGDNRQAGLVFDRMARVAEDNPQRLLKSAQLQMSARNHHAAILILDILLKRFPNFYPAQGLMAEIEMSQGKLDSAESRARALADRTPNLSLPHRIFGDIAMAQGRYPEALSNYKKAISIERNPEYAIRQSRAYIALGDSVNARAVLESWTRSDPNDILVAEALAESLLAAGELKSARAKYEALMKRYGERAGWLNNLANILWRLGDSQAKTFAERAYKLDPSDPYIADTVGWILVQTAQIEAGLQYLRDARLRNPSNPEIRYHLAFALAKVGRSKEAIQELDYALASAVPFDETGEAKKLRQSLIH